MDAQQLLVQNAQADSLADALVEATHPAFLAVLRSAGASAPVTAQAVAGWAATMLVAVIHDVAKPGGHADLARVVAGAVAESLTTVDWPAYAAQVDRHHATAEPAQRVLS